MFFNGKYVYDIIVSLIFFWYELLIYNIKLGLFKGVFIRFVLGMNIFLMELMGLGCYSDG